ncbi:hypothetical protein DFH06DRAFT_1301671 [Mycena polygramma]|nr:hypothetical protein DFH06DRAFT_1301671 [Mycena polygramma]
MSPLELTGKPSCETGSFNLVILWELLLMASTSCSTPTILYVYCFAFTFSGAEGSFQPFPAHKEGRIVSRHRVQVINKKDEHVQPSITGLRSCPIVGPAATSGLLDYLLITDSIEPTPRRFDLPRENDQPRTAEMVAYPVHVVPGLYILVEVPIKGFVRGWSEGRKSGLAECWCLVKALDGVTFSQKTGVLHKNCVVRDTTSTQVIQARQETIHVSCFDPAWIDSENDRRPTSVEFGVRRGKRNPLGGPFIDRKASVADLTRDNMLEHDIRSVLAQDSDQDSEKSVQECGKPKAGVLGERREGS